MQGPAVGEIMVRSYIDDFRSLSLEMLLHLLPAIEGKWRSLWGFCKSSNKMILLMGRMMYIHTLILWKIGACCSCNLKNRGKDRMIEEGLMNRKKHPSRGRIWAFKDDIAFAAKSLDVRKLPPNKRSALNYWKHNKMSLGTEKENTTLLCPPFSPSATDYWVKKRLQSPIVFRRERKSYL